MSPNTSPSLNFLRAGTAFDPEELSCVGQAFEMVCAEMHRAHRQCDSETIAAEIIGVASHGNFNPDWLAATTLKILNDGKSAAG
jgi:hypothetical protein